MRRTFLGLMITVCGALLTPSLSWSAPAPATRPASQPAPPSGGAIGPKGPQFRPADRAMRIVFVCAGNASMAPKFDVVKAELGKVLQFMDEDQSFNITFLQGAGSVRFNGSVLAPATAANKLKAATFLADTKFAATGDPIVGIANAFAQKPQLLYLLTNGDFRDNDAVLKKVRELNKPVDGKRPVKVNTIAFVDDKDTDTAFIELLDTIARENGGNFVRVANDELTGGAEKPTKAEEPAKPGNR